MSANNKLAATFYPDEPASRPSIRNGKGKAAFKRKREQLLRRVQRDELPCHICGLPFDLTLPPQHAMSFTADHVEPLALGGHLVRNELLPAHRSCNARRGAHGDPEIWEAS
jgi:5-methylcytosine-specific restriction endonuclease McrA